MKRTSGGSWSLISTDRRINLDFWVDQLYGTVGLGGALVLLHTVGPPVSRTIGTGSRTVPAFGGPSSEGASVVGLGLARGQEVGVVGSSLSDNQCFCRMLHRLHLRTKQHSF